MGTRQGPTLISTSNEAAVQRAGWRDETFVGLEEQRMGYPSLQGMKSWILETRPMTAEMFPNGCDQSSMEMGTSHRKDSMEGSTKFLGLFWPVLLNEIRRI